MNSYRQPFIRAHQRLSLILCLFGTLLFGALAEAATLGPIQVKSALGQAFEAEIEVKGLLKDDILTAQARMANADEYKAAKSEYVTLVRQIRVTIEPRSDKRTFLVLRSNAPASEPAINLLVEFSWRGGRIVQTYPILLDPPKG